MHEQEFYDRLNRGDENERAARNSLSDDDKATESLLKSFGPASSGIDRERLMFLAGRASGFAEAARPQASGASRGGANRAWVWPAATAVMSAISLMLAIALVVRPAPPIADRNGSAPPAPSRRQMPPQVPAPGENRALVDDSTPGEGEGLASGFHQRMAHGEAVQSAVSHARSYLSQREIALKHGVDALPISAAPGENVARAALPQRKMLEELLPPGAVENSDSGPFGQFFSWPSFNHSEDNL